MPAVALVLVLALAACAAEPDGPSPTATTDGLGPLAAEDSVIAARLGLYATARLDVDLSALADSDRVALAHLVEAATLMNVPFRTLAGGDLDTLGARRSEAAQRYAAINYGPWDRLDGDAPFVPGVDAKPLGAGLYPPDTDPDALLATADLYPELGLTERTTLVRRDGGTLIATPYHDAFPSEHGRAAAHLRAAATAIQDTALADALRLRADALLSGNAQAADAAQAALQSPALDAIVGPAERFEDGLLGRKATHAGAALVHAPDWDARLADALRQLAADSMGTGTGPTVEVMDAALLAGQANAGPKPMALDLPAGADAPARRVVLRNVAAAKADRVLLPLAGLVVHRDQRDRVTVDAFVQHAVVHELAHAKTTGDDALDEAIADARALRLAARLADAEDESWVPFEEAAVTFLASIVRTVRFGAAGPRGRARLVLFNRLLDAGALVPEAERDGDVWRVATERLVPALDALLGDVSADDLDADAFVRQWGRSTPAIADALDRLDAAGVPADVVFHQGAVVLGLPPAPPLSPARSGARL